MESKMFISGLVCLVLIQFVICQDLKNTRVLRRKRLISGKKWMLWPDGKIPYCYASNLPAFKYPIYSAAMDTYQKRTCLKFVLSDCRSIRSGGIKLLPGGQPYAYFGRQWSLKSVTLASGYPTVMHELFHVAGGYHEQMNYKNIAVAPINYKNIMPYYRKEYLPQYSEKDKMDGDIITTEYDLGNPAFYSQYGTSLTGFPNYDLMYPDLFHTDLSHAFFDMASKEIQEFYDCWKLKNCSLPKPVCENEGYAGYYNDKCGCVCPAGLDRASNCTQIKTKPTGTWPDSDVRVLKTTAGCPSGMKESTIKITGVTGFTTSSDYSLPISLSGDTLTLYLCNKQGAGNTEVWDHAMNGFVAENNKCPSKLGSGSVEFYNRNKHNVGSIMFCLGEGILQEPLLGIPSDEEFAVFARENTCQEIDGFIGEKESFTIQHPNITVTDKIPHHKLTTAGDKFLTLDYCVYRPLTYNCGGVIRLSPFSSSMIIQSPNFPNTYPQNTECNWIIQVEKDARIRAKFTYFDINDADVFNYRRYILTAMPTRIKKGSRLPDNIVSIFNRMAIQLKTGTMGSGGNGFQIEVTHLGEDDYCYNVHDRGETYDGDWNYAIDGTKCLPWNLRFDNNFTLSGYADFDGTASSFLTGSACRNPQGKLHAPACVTYAKGGNYSLRYCDVCHIEYGIRDVYEYCEKAVATDPAICSGPTAGKCLKTCLSSGLIPAITTPRKVGNVTCPTPTVPSEATHNANTVKSEYHPGDVIQLDCSSGKTVDISCTSSGNWSEWSDPCRGCPAGWAEFSGKCYKVVGRVDNWYKANSYCSYYYNASLLIIKTQKIHDFFLSWRHKLGPVQKWWVGGRNWDGTWRWDDDGSAMSSYETSSSFVSPNNTKWGKRCVVHNTGTTWNSDKCLYRRNFMCVKSLGKPITCTDRKEECSILLNENPRACLDPVIKTNVCPYTCGADVCNPTGNECSSVPVPANAHMVTSKTSMGPGEVVEFTCDPGYENQGGSLVRACMRDGSLSGSDPVCTIVSAAITPVNDFPMGKFRSATLNYLTVYTGESKQLEISRDGKIYSWQLYCSCDARVKLQVWRLVKDRTYKLIGSNTIQCFSGLVRDVHIDAADRISVQAGDKIGLFDIRGGCFTYYSCRSGSMPEFSDVHYLFASSEAEIATSAQKQFSGSSCKMFSVNANVGP